MTPAECQPGTIVMAREVLGITVGELRTNRTYGEHWVNVNAPGLDRPVTMRLDWLEVAPPLFAHAFAARQAVERACGIGGRDGE